MGKGDNTVSVTYNVTSSRKNEWDEATNEEIMSELKSINRQVKMLDISLTIMIWTMTLAFAVMVML